MRNFVILLMVALLAIAILLFLFNPEILEKIWLWIVGLIGVIITAIRNAIKGLVNLVKPDKEEQAASNTNNTGPVPENGSSPVVSNGGPQTPATSHLNEKVLKYEQKIEGLESQILLLKDQLKNSRPFDNFNGTTLTVLRYYDDGATTLGFLFYEDEFFCYTLEDTYRDVKIKYETRIPEGTYKLGFNRTLTELTKKYRQSRTWFEYHLHVKNVPNYSNIYIHVGNTIKDTAGCLLVAKSIESSNARRAIFNSREAFKELYLKLKPIIDSGQEVRIRYFNEDWFERFKLKKIVA